MTTVAGLSLTKCLLSSFVEYENWRNRSVKEVPETAEIRDSGEMFIGGEFFYTSAFRRIKAFTNEHDQTLWISTTL